MVPLVARVLLGQGFMGGGMSRFEGSGVYPYTSFAVRRELNPFVVFSESLLTDLEIEKCQRLLVKSACCGGFVRIAEFVNDFVLHLDKGNIAGRALDLGYLDDDLAHKHDFEKFETSGALNGR